jgi:hypothetical protein
VAPADDSLAVRKYGPWQRLRDVGPLTRVVACFGCCALVFTGLVLAGGAWYKAFMLGRNMDRLCRDVLADGDVDMAYKRAHAQLQAPYPREAFLEYARRSPGVFQREKLTGLEVRWLTGASGLYVVLTARVAEDGGEAEVSYYCLATGNQTFRLVGIAPGLDAAVPPNLKLWEN